MSDFAFEAQGGPAPSSATATTAAAPAGAGVGAARRATPAPGALRLPAALLLTTASGLALWTSFPALGWWPAAPLALAGYALAARGQRPRRGFVLGLVGGLAFMIPHLHWSGVYVGLLPWSALATLEALFIAAMCALVPLAWRAPGGRTGTVLALTGLWVAQEAARGRIPFGGFPWARVAFSQSQAPTLGYAALGGAPLVSAAVAAAGACLAVAAVTLTDLVRRRRTATAQPPQASTSAPVGLALALAAAAAILLGGLAVPRAAGTAPASAPAAGSSSGSSAASSGWAQVAAVQGNVPTAGLEFNAQRRAVLDNHAQATTRLAADVAAGRTPRPDVVLWPENSSDIDPLTSPDAAQVITRATDAIGVPVLIGAVLAEPAPNVSNASILWGPTGSPAAGPGQRYVKRHPAPFAEYIPYRSFFRLFSDKVDLVRADFLPGHGVGVMQAGPVRFGTVICFEVAYDGLVRDTVRSGAQLLVVQTNNATFGYTDESVQQLAMSRLRAVESGRAVVHISTVGVSALITPDGHQVARSDHFAQQVLTAQLPLRTGLTVADRVGAAPEAALAVLGLALAGFGARRARSRWAARGNNDGDFDGEGSRPDGRDDEQEPQL